MRFDRFTIKAQEAIQAAGEMAEKFNQQEIKPEHLLAAMLEQSDGVTGTILKKLGTDPEMLQTKLQEILNNQPRVYGNVSQVYISPALKDILDKGKPLERVGRKATSLKRKLRSSSCRKKQDGLSKL